MAKNKYFSENTIIFPYTYEGHDLWSNLGEIVECGTFGSHFTIMFSSGPILNYVYGGYPHGFDPDQEFLWEDFEVACNRDELPNFIAAFMPHLKQEVVAHICAAIDSLIGGEPA